MDGHSKVMSNNLAPWLPAGTAELLGQSHILQDTVRQ